jgi:ribonuclease-3
VSAGPPKDRRSAAIAELETRIGYRFKDRELLDRALTHASAGDGAKHILNNERLEFLGDRVLNLFAAERLMHLYPDEREGDLSKRMHGLVSRDACAGVARRIGLPAALRLAGGETKQGGRDNPTILGDACEALLAGLYIDAGMERAREAFCLAWSEAFEVLDTLGAANPKSELQEWAAARKLPQPSYAVTGRSGPDHAPLFTVELALGELEPVQAKGRSRQEAEKAAAQAMLDREVRL